MMSFATTALLALSGFSAAEASWVQIVHLSPDAPNVDVWVDGDGPQLTNVPYLAATPSYNVTPGQYSVDISATGSADPVLSGTGRVQPMSAYTLAVWNDLANLSAAPLQNDIDGLAPGNIRLQVTHAAVGVGTVDLWELSTGTKLIDGFDFGATDRLDVPAGALDLGLDLDADAVPDVTFQVPELGADTLVNVFAIADTDGVALYAVYLDGMTARVDAD